MAKRVNSLLVGLGFFISVLLFFIQRYSDTSKDQITRENTDAIEYADESIDSLKVIQQVVNQQRRMIREEMMDYQYPNGKYNISANKLEDLLVETNGKPIRSVIVSTWRSGSTFLGAVLAAHPGNFYHFEPLLDLGIVQIRGPPMAAKALRTIRDLLKCDYSELDHYIESTKICFNVFNYNTPLSEQCRLHKGICYNHRFLSEMCKSFPFQSMKLVRLRLGVAQELLADEKLAVRLVLLIRDPRGIIQSRKHRDFCQGKPDCNDPSSICADLTSDYNVAVELQKKYPHTFRVIRYEDLAVEPYKQVEELFKFYGLDFHPNVTDFLDTHTKSDAGGVWSTFRNSKVAPFHWKTDLKFQVVKEIQRSCVGAMEHWGYVPAMNITHQREFNPITDYVLNL